MMADNDFLLELGTEELPAEKLLQLADSLGANILSALNKVGLAHGNLQVFATPRRLAVLVKEVAAMQPTQLIERRGPLLHLAFTDDGSPTKAAMGFAKSVGVEVSELRVKKIVDGEYLCFTGQTTGSAATKLLPEVVNEALRKLAITRFMRWGEGNLEFIRPVCWVVMLLGEEVLPATLFNLVAGRITYGHRFHAPQALSIPHPRQYVELLNKGRVIADFMERKNIIREQLISTANDLGRVVIDEQLLNEVTGLVEWPCAFRGKFSAEFLKIPQEALITSMKYHQKCFPMVDSNQKLLPYFIIISNIDTKDADTIIEGNERVMQARLKDAQFFYQNDLKQTLSALLPQLHGVVFQNQLGSLLAKVKRLELLAKYLAEKLNADKDQAQRAALLCKADLLTAMVGEFPELQGIMGYYYAKHAGEKEDVAMAIKEHYYPRFATDELPETIYGSIIAIADRLDSLIGIFGINQAPTGDKDPFALRRAALGMLRIMILKELPLDLPDLIACSIQSYETMLKNPHLTQELTAFIWERLRSWYNEQGVAIDVFNAVLARNPIQPYDFAKRIQAVAAFQKLPQAKALAAANKRINNILKHETDDGEKVLNELLQAPAERQLAELLTLKEQTLTAYGKTKDYVAMLKELASLQQPIDQFFQEVLVMVDNHQLRANRLRLLQRFKQLFLTVADISLLYSESHGS